MAAPNNKLRQARQERSLSMEELARRIGTTKEVIYRWEKGITSPNPSSRRRLCEFFGMSLQELGLLSEESVPQPQEEQALSLPEEHQDIPQEPISEPQKEQALSLPEEHQGIPREPVHTGGKRAPGQKEIIFVLLIVVVVMGGLVGFLLLTLEGYSARGNSQHIDFIGTDGHVHELYAHPGVGWVNNDLIVLAGGGTAPVLGGALDAYWSSDNSQHIDFIGTDGHVHELYIYPGAG